MSAQAFVKRKTLKNMPTHQLSVFGGRVRSLAVGAEKWALSSRKLHVCKRYSDPRAVHRHVCIREQQEA